MLFQMVSCSHFTLQLRPLFDYLTGADSAILLSAAG